MVVEWDPESGWLVGEVVELLGCYSQAPDLQQLEANVREAVEAVGSALHSGRYPAAW